MYMAIHVTNPVVEAKLREVAKSRGVSLTEAIDLAVEALRAQDRADIERRLAAMRAIQARVAAYPDTGLKADKAFYDSLNDE
jgi:antitoxin VapB